MRHLSLALVLLALAGLLSAPSAAAAGEVTDEGWRIFLPEGFQSAPTSVGARLGARVRKLFSATGISLTSGPRIRQFVRLGPGGEEATLLVLRYQLPPESHIKSVADLDLESVQRAVTLTAQSAGDLEVQRIDKAALNSSVHGIRFLVIERGPTGDVGEFRFVIVVDSGYAVIVALRAQDWAKFDVPDAWQRVLASLQITRVEPGIDRYFWLGGAGLAVLLFGMVLVFLYRRLRDTGPPTAMILDPTEREHSGVGGSDVAFVDTGSRAMDGLPTFTGAPPGAGVSESSPHAPPPAPGTVAAPLPPRIADPAREPARVVTSAPGAIPGLTPDIEDFDKAPSLKADSEEDAPLRPQLDYTGTKQTSAPDLPPPPPAKDDDDPDGSRFSGNDKFLE